MKLKTFTLSIILLLFSWAFQPLTALAQCDPMTAEECPDPENNGEICPDSLEVAFLNQPYSQVATILAPLQDTLGIPLHHLTLVSVDNLPPGLTWVSNAPNNEFMAGNYYCILMEGTPTEAGTFYLKIVVDIYINFFGTPVFALQVTDSTSLAIQVVDASSIHEDYGSALSARGNMPNPFKQWTSVVCYSEDEGVAGFSVFNLMGERVYERKLQVRPGENHVHFDGSRLPPGTYLYRILKDGNITGGTMVRSR